MKPKKPFQIDDLTSRQREVIVLIGRGMGYARAARQMRNKHGSQDGESECISPRTVEKYATQIRDLTGSSAPPLRTLIHLYHAHREELETAA